MEVRIVSFVNGDWYGLYLGEELVLEGHELDVKDVLEALQIDFTNYSADFDGKLPKYISDIKGLIEE